MEKSSRAVFRVGGLKDDRGRQEIERNLSLINGVRSVTVDIGDNTVGVNFDPSVIGEEYLKRTLNSLGYSPYQF